MLTWEHYAYIKTDATGHCFFHHPTSCMCRVCGVLSLVTCGISCIAHVTALSDPLMGVQSSVFNRQAPIDQISAIFGVVSDVERQRGASLVIRLKARLKARDWWQGKIIGHRASHEGTSLSRATIFPPADKGGVLEYWNTSFRAAAWLFGQFMVNEWVRGEYNSIGLKVVSIGAGACQNQLST
jgi:hypothetical protein